MKRFIELVTPIVEAKGDKVYVEVLSTIQTMLDNSRIEVLAETGTIDLSTAFSFTTTNDKKCLCPFTINIEITEDDLAHKASLRLSEVEATSLIRAIQKKLAEIKMLNVYTRPLREM